MTTSATVDDGRRLAFALVEFVDSARLWGAANFIDDNEICSKAIVRSQAAVETILDLTGDVDVLLPLLEHDNLAVRLKAAVNLLGDHRDAAVATLRELDTEAPMDISWFGGLYLQLIGVPNTGSGFKPPKTGLHEFPPKRREKKIQR